MISIIVPLYKGKCYVKTLILMVEKEVEKLRRKFDEEVEVVFVNDYPEEYVKCPKSDLIKVKLINQQCNEGIHQARIVGLENSEGQYIHFLDQDDKVSSDFLIKMLTQLLVENADICVCGGEHNYKNKAVLLYKHRNAMKLVMKKDVYVYGTDMIFSPGQCLIKRESIPEEWKKIIMRQNGCDDFFLWLIMLSQKKKFVVFPENLYHHTDNGSNYSLYKDKMYFSFEEMIELLGNNNILSKNEINVLKLRLRLRRARYNHNLVEELVILFKNPLIIYYTLKYKLSGYD